MQNGKKYILITWILSLILCNIVLFGFADQVTENILYTSIFVEIAFISSLIFILYSMKHVDDFNHGILHVPLVILSLSYSIIQLPVCIACVLIQGIVSTKIIVLFNLILLIVIWLFAIISVIGNQHINEVNYRQKDHHIEL